MTNDHGLSAGASVRRECSPGACACAVGGCAGGAHGWGLHRLDEGPRGRVVGHEPAWDRGGGQSRTRIMFRGTQSRPGASFFQLSLFSKDTSLSPFPLSAPPHLTSSGPSFRNPTPSASLPGEAPSRGKKTKPWHRGSPTHSAATAERVSRIRQPPGQSLRGHG